MPLLFSPMGYSDPDGICGLIGNENWMIAHVWEVETQSKQARKLGAERGTAFDIEHVLMNRNMYL